MNSSASRTWAEAGLDEPTADRNGARQACGVTVRRQPLNPVITVRLGPYDQHHRHV
jgi:hypothetical protein